mgnify:CR=1 FL=1
MTDIEIAKSIKIQPITKIAKKIGIKKDDLELYGKYKAKINYKNISSKKKAKLILVTAINPTPAGEGKTTVSIGLADGLNIIKKKTVLALREPSLGPVFGVKGGATGGGYSQVVPMEDINLHFTGDFHAITSANNLLSSMIDNHIFQGNELNINPEKILFNRCMDLNDRALRNVEVGSGKGSKYVPHQDHFNITAASEIMSILCLSKDLEDLKENLGNITVALNKDDEPVYAKDLKAENAMAILLKDAVNPNLVQTLAGTPALVHGGPFANIAHGCNTIIATKTAMKLADYVVTEAGFGADLGAEKFLDLKCRRIGVHPDCVVIVATIRALKMHGGVDKENIKKENIEALIKGCENLKKHISNIKDVYGLNCVVAINKFNTDTDKEISTLKEQIAPLTEVEIVKVHSDGGKGTVNLAKKVVELCDKDCDFNYSYDINDSIENKITEIAKRIYGANNIIFKEKALESLKVINKYGYDKYPVVIAKTQYSLSDDPKKLNAPKDFDITIRDLEVRSGAKMIVALAGEMLLMPGLSKEPAAVGMKIENGTIEGLF